VYGARRILKNAPISSKAFSHYQNDGAMRWMARWQEQEDGMMKNFSIIVLAKDW
jgi:hypothetical protein